MCWRLKFKKFKVNYVHLNHVFISFRFATFLVWILVHIPPQYGTGTVVSYIDLPCFLLFNWVKLGGLVVQDKYDNSSPPHAYFYNLEYYDTCTASKHRWDVVPRHKSIQFEQTYFERRSLSTTYLSWFCFILRGDYIMYCLGGMGLQLANSCLSMFRWCMTASANKL